MKIFVCFLAVVVATCSAGYIGGGSSGGHRHLKIVHDQPGHEHGVKIVKVIHQQPEVKTIHVVHEHSAEHIHGSGGYSDGGYPVGGGAGIGSFTTHKSLRNFGGSEGNGGLFDSYGVPIIGSGYH